MSNRYKNKEKVEQKRRMKSILNFGILLILGLLLINVLVITATITFNIKAIYSIVIIKISIVAAILSLIWYSAFIVVPVISKLKVKRG